MLYAGFWRRFVAVVIDWMILILPSVAMGYLLPYVGGMAMAIAYFPVFESSSIQATPGKYVMGMKVVSEDGTSLSFLRALARHFLKMLSWLVCGIGYLIQPFTTKRQTLHDLISGAVVVRHEFQSPPNWWEAWLTQMKFIFRVDDKPAQPTEPLRSPSSTATSVATAASSVETSAAIDSIEKLHDLYKQGAISEEEYQSKKATFLKQI